MTPREPSGVTVTRKALLFLAALALFSVSPGGWNVRPQASTEDWRALLEAANRARLAGDLDGAMEQYRAVVARNPNELSAWWYLCTLAYDAGKYVEAKDAALEMTNRWPGYGAAYAMLGLAYFNLGNFPEALRNFQQARVVGIGPHEALQRLVRYYGGMSLLRLGEFEAAFQAFEGFAYENRRFLRVVEGLGLCMLRLPYLPEQIPEDQRALVQEVGEAAFAWEGGLRDEAKAKFRGLLERYPDVPNLHYSFGALIQVAYPEEALEQFLAELEKNPAHLLALVQVAFEYIRRGEYERARPYAERAVQVDPTDFAGRFAKGRVLLELGEVEAAVRELEKAVELAPQKPEVRFVLARAYRQQGRREEAQEQFQEFQRLTRMLQEAEEFLKERDYSTKQGTSGEAPARP
ncbi:MAG: hypothetical protein Kow00109_10520 [Acidobacteriota bacterium]